MERHPVIPQRFRAQEKDRYMNYLRRAGMMMVQMELDFDYRLDVERLEKAIDFTLDAEPVLGCRFVKGWWRPHWERLSGQRQVFIIAADNSEYEAFKHDCIDTYIGPQLKVCLLRRAEGDRLLFKVAHEVADACAVKQIVSVASSIYNRLADDTQYIPPPNLKGSRSSWQIFRFIPYRIYPLIYFNFYARWCNNIVPLKTFRLPVGQGEAQDMSYVYRSIPADRAARLKEFGHARGATLNDIMLAAYFRALADVGKWDRRSQLRLILMVDLRRYRPDRKAEGICYLSGTEPFDYGVQLGDDFEATLKRVSAITRRRKNNWMGLSDCAGLAPFVSLFPYSVLERTLVPLVNVSIKVGNGPDVITNIGVIEEQDVTFDARPTHARFIPPVNYPPHIVFGISSYGGEVNLCAGVFKFQREPVERLFDEMIRVLPL